MFLCQVPNHVSQQAIYRVLRCQNILSINFSTIKYIHLLVHVEMSTDQLRFLPFLFSIIHIENLNMLRTMSVESLVIVQYNTKSASLKMKAAY